MHPKEGSGQPFDGPVCAPQPSACLHSIVRDLPSLAGGRAARRLTVAVLGPSSHPVAEPYVGGLESFVGGLVDEGHD